MSALSDIEKLSKAVLALFELPQMQLEENQPLKNQIKNIIGSGTIQGILNDIKYEYEQEKASALYDSRNPMAFNADSLDFLMEYSKYQAAGFDVLSNAKNKQVAFTQPLNKKMVMAFNSNGKNPFEQKQIKYLKKTKHFVEAFNSVMHYEREKIKALNSIYSDKSLQIGTTRDPTIISNYLDYTPYIWNMRHYLGIHTLAQTIQHPNALATRQIPKIEFSDEKLSEKMEKHLLKTEVNDLVIKKMLHFSDISPRGSLMVPIDDNGKIRFNVFNDTQFTYATSYQYSKIDFEGTRTGVHNIYCLGHMLQNEVTAFFLCPDFEPLFALGKNQVYRLKDIAEAINIFIYTIKVLCIRSQVITTKGGGGGMTDSKIAAQIRTLRQINSRLSLSEAVQLSEDQEMDILPSNFTTGFSEVPVILKEVQGMLSGLHGDFYYGSSNAYQANSFNLNISHQNINSEIQLPKIAPLYRFAINFLLQHDTRFKEYEKYVDDFEIKFKSLYEMTEQEKTELHSRQIDNLIKMRDYPELEDEFKKEGLLRDEFSMVGKDPREPQNSET